MPVPVHVAPRTEGEEEREREIYTRTQTYTHTHTHLVKADCVGVQIGARVTALEPHLREHILVSGTYENRV